MNNTFGNFTDCYLSLASQVYHEPDFVCRPRGQKIKEKLGVKFTITNPRDRIPYVRARKFSIHYMIAELLWYLSGDDSTEWISNYSSFWRKISDDGLTANSAYGARIFRPHDRVAGDSFTQWEYIIQELREDRDSRRAVVHIRSPIDSQKAKLDVPCTLTLQFFIRDDCLHMIVNMRSSDLILGIAYDVPAFTFMQEMLARQLQVGLGTYTHISNSLHIYEKHFKMVENMLAKDELEQAGMHRISRGPMPAFEGAPPIDDLFLFEKELRSIDSLEGITKLTDDFCSLDTGDLSYWNDWAKILASHRLNKVGLKNNSSNMLNSTTFAGYHMARSERNYE